MRWLYVYLSLRLHRLLRCCEPSVSRSEVARERGEGIEFAPSSPLVPATASAHQWTHDVAAACLSVNV